MNTRHISRLRLILGIFFLGLAMVGCSPSLSPLYRDYQVPADSSYTAADMSRLRSALQEAGWTVKKGDKSNVLRTQSRVVDNWLLYKIEVSLETIPINEKHVRLFIHPRRRYITGGQTKISFLKEGLREELVPPLTDALEAHGFEIANTSSSRDRQLGG